MLHPFRAALTLAVLLSSTVFAQERYRNFEAPIYVHHGVIFEPGGAAGSGKRREVCDALLHEPGFA